MQLIHKSKRKLSTSDSSWLNKFREICSVQSYTLSQNHSQIYKFVSECVSKYIMFPQPFVRNRKEMKKNPPRKIMVRHEKDRQDFSFSLI